MARFCILTLYSDFNTEFEFKFENDTLKLPKQSKDNADRAIPEHNWYLASGLLKRLKDTNDEDQVASRNYFGSINHRRHKENSHNQKRKGVLQECNYSGNPWNIKSCNQ
jgi:hypothetical protein